MPARPARTCPASRRPSRPRPSRGPSAAARAGQEQVEGGGEGAQIVLQRVERPIPRSASSWSPSKPSPSSAFATKLSRPRAEPPPAVHLLAKLPARPLCAGAGLRRRGLGRGRLRQRRLRCVRSERPPARPPDWRPPPQRRAAGPLLHRGEEEGLRVFGLSSMSGSSSDVSRSSSSGCFSLVVREVGVVGHRGRFRCGRGRDGSVERRRFPRGLVGPLRAAFIRRRASLTRLARDTHLTLTTHTHSERIVRTIV